MDSTRERDPELCRSLTSALRSLGYDHRARADESNPLTRVFNLNQRIPVASIAPDTLAALQPFIDAGLLEAGDHLESHVRVAPVYESWIFVDSPRRYRHQPDRYTYIGNDGMILLDFARARMDHIPRDAPILDLCAGSGMIGIVLARDFQDVTCADIHGPALQWAERNRDLNRVDVKIVQSDLFERVPGPYRVIIANPSYSFYPDAHVQKTGMVDYETGGAYGLELTDRILEELDLRLSPDGDAFVCTVDPTVRGKSLLTAHLHDHFDRRDYAVVVHHLHRDRGKFHQFEDFYRGLGVSDLQFVIIHLRRGQPASVTNVPLPLVRDFIEGLRFTVNHNPVYRRARRWLGKG